MEWPENRDDDNAGNPGNQAERNTNFYIIVECKVTRSEDECVWRSSHWCSECHGSCDTKCHQYRFRITSDCLSDGDTDRSKKCCGCGVGHELCQNVGDQEQYSGQEVRARVITHSAYDGVSNQFACAGLFHSGCNGKHTSEQEDCYPVDTSICFFFFEAAGDDAEDCAGYCCGLQRNGRE